MRTSDEKKRKSGAHWMRALEQIMKLAPNRLKPQKLDSFSSLFCDCELYYEKESKERKRKRGEERE